MLQRKIKNDTKNFILLENRIDRMSRDSSRVQEERWLNNLSQQENETVITKNIILSDNDLKTNFSSFCETISSPKLVIRFSYLGCEMCIDSALTILKKYQNSINFNNVVLWATYNSQNDLALFKNVNKILYKTYLIKSLDTVITADKYSIPYMFVLLPGQKEVHELFFPFKENSLRTEEYFNNLSIKYYQNPHKKN